MLLLAIRFRLSRSLPMKVIMVRRWRKVAFMTSSGAANPGCRRLFRRRRFLRRCTMETPPGSPRGRLLPDSTRYTAVCARTLRL
jgi:hypothetical protein